MGTTGYLRFPTVSGDQIVFTAEDDLWRVSVAGGRAERLTAGVASATRAHFSPDGRQIAFTGSDEGPEEVYVMPADGGPARRLTYHAGRSEVVGWQPDGAKILFAGSSGVALGRRIFAVSPQGGEPERLPFGVANAIAYGPNGAVVLGRNIREPAFWKRYRGGTAGYLWIDAAGSGEFKRLLNLNSNIAAPCWVGERIFFLSDHEGIANVYSCLPTGEDVRRHSTRTRTMPAILPLMGDCASITRAATCLSWTHLPTRKHGWRLIWPGRRRSGRASLSPRASSWTPGRCIPKARP